MRFSFIRSRIYNMSITFWINFTCNASLDFSGSSYSVPCVLIRRGSFLFFRLFIGTTNVFEVPRATYCARVWRARLIPKLVTVGRYARLKTKQTLVKRASGLVVVDSNLLYRACCIRLNVAIFNKRLGYARGGYFARILFVKIRKSQLRINVRSTLERRAGWGWTWRVTGRQENGECEWMRDGLVIRGAATVVFVTTAAVPVRVVHERTAPHRRWRVESRPTWVTARTLAWAALETSVDGGGMLAARDEITTITII